MIRIKDSYVNKGALLVKSHYRVSPRGRFMRGFRDTFQESASTSIHYRLNSWRLWHADELFVKMRNGIDYRKNNSIAFLWNVMDRKTRCLQASKLSPLRDHIGANRAFDVVRKNAHGDYPDRLSLLIQRELMLISNTAQPRIGR